MDSGKTLKVEDDIQSRLFYGLPLKISSTTTLGNPTLTTQRTVWFLKLIDQIYNYSPRVINISKY